MGQQSTAELRAAYEALAAQTLEMSKRLPKYEAELQAEVKQRLKDANLDIDSVRTRKREAYMAWEKAAQAQALAAAPTSTMPVSIEVPRLDPPAAPPEITVPAESIEPTESPATSPQETIPAENAETTEPPATPPELTIPAEDTEEPVEQ